jgi:hypothetical protein
VWLASAVALVMLAAGRCHPPPDPASPFDRKTTDGPTNRTTLDGHKKPQPPITLPDEVVVRAMEPMRPLFVRCFKRAIDADPTTVSFKVRLRLEVDATGMVEGASSDASDPGLATCLIRIGRAVRFPAPNRRAVVELPLIYRE